MKKLSLIILCFSLFAISSSTKVTFVLLGSLGDLAKKYLWSALHQLYIDDIDDNIKIFGASRNTPDEGKEILDNILNKIPEASRSPVIEDLENKFIGLLNDLPEASSRILSEGQEKLNEVLDSLPEASQNVQEKLASFINDIPEKSSNILSEGQEKLNKVLESLPEASQNVQEKLTSFINDIPEKSSNILAQGKDKLTQLFNNIPQAKEKLANFINTIPETSHSLFTEGQEKLSNILSDIFEVRPPFRDNVNYLQLKKEEHFAKFCADVTDELLIFYLSIPPSAYITTTEMIAKHCKKTGVVVRVAYEKPFGYDSQSAEILFSSLEALIEKDNIYLIDHYLGKTITQQIIPLRRSNKELESVLNKEHVASIHVNLLEKLDCEGRAGYYDKSGVVRDMLQNHATELLLLVTSDLLDDLPRAKAAMLGSLSQPNKHQVVVAQYERYLTHVGTESTIPTFASALFTSNSTRWADVPIIVTSGKSQAVERKNIAVTFKSGGTLEVNYKPAVVTFKNINLLPEDFTAKSNSYITLLDSVIKGQKDLLPSVDTVLASWGLWGHVIAMQHNLLLHQNNKNMEVKQYGKFLIAGNTENPLASEHIKFFNKAFMISDHEEHLYEHVAEDIIRVIGDTLEKERVVHIAFSGGNTVLGVYKYLIARSMKTVVSWNKVHIWQVDERCHPDHRNSKDLKYFLLDDIFGVIPANVHYMPVSKSGCGDINEYQKTFKYYNSERKFNYVLLGLGADGHTASLFPKSKTIAKTRDFKHVRVETRVSPERMTVTFDLINKSDWVSILVTGPGKGDVIKGIRQGEVFPVSMVSSTQLTWFIDEILL